MLLDRSSLVVGYDPTRGEPRGRGRDRAEKGLGDCVDCGLCVDVCPTGIDIRDGLQLECVNCTQCIDACDDVMDKVGQPRGLIRYSAQGALEGEKTRILRPRVIIYSGVLTVLLGVFLTLLTGREAFDVTLLRGLGRPFVVEGAEVENLVRAKLVNRTDAERSYRVEPVEPASLRLREDVSVSLPAGETSTEPLHLIAPADEFAQRGGTLEATLRFIDSEGETIEKRYRLFGPAGKTGAP